MGQIGAFDRLLDWRVGITRRTFLRNTSAVIAGAALPLAGYAEFIEPRHLTIGRLEVPIPNLPKSFDGFRIAQLSDFHYMPYTRKAEIDAAVDLATSLRPDLIVLTGDFVTSTDEPGKLRITDPVFSHVAVCAALLSRLKAPHGVFACAGNHDALIGTTYVQGALADVGIPLLRNESRPIERDGGRIWLAGLDDAEFDHPDFLRTLSRVPKDEVAVLMAHEPDIADESSRYPFALQLSGHSHGGQIRLPIVGSLYLPDLAKKYPYGYYQIGGLHLYTNRGIGEILLPYRFNAPPEVTLVTLRRAPESRH